MIDSPAKPRTWTDILREVVDSGGHGGWILVEASRLAALVDDSRPPEWWSETGAEIGSGLDVAYDRGEELPHQVKHFAWQVGVLADWAQGLIDAGLLAADL